MTSLYKELLELSQQPARELAPWDPDEEGTSVNYVVLPRTDRVDVSFETGEHVWIEREEGRIRVHCFDPNHDSPMNVEIYKDRIVIDSHDYEVEHIQ